MQLFFRDLEKIEVLGVSEDATIAGVKNQLAQVHSFDTEELTLNCEGITLSNDTPVTIPMLGGKVLGSLARAGKVKALTPKVEKQEKKKKKTGHAKRRIQYNRRFVNVVQGFGRRRGPNTNCT